MPIVRSAFNGNKYWRNGHFETILPALFRKTKIEFLRERLELPDSDFMDLDWVRKGQPRLLLLFHGLEGSSQSQYIKGFTRFFSSLEFDVCAVNFRNCSGSQNRLLRSYHSGVSEDVHEVLNHVLRSFSFTEIYLGGFSLGGNVVLKYLGEKKYPVPKQVKSAIAFSAPIDLASSALELEKPENRKYMRMFLFTLNKKMLEKAKRFPGLFDASGYQKIKTFAEWDHRFTAPLNGFKSGSDYYETCSSKQFLKNIEIPTLLVNAKNDPFLAAECFPEESEIGRQLVFESPDFGGHCGFAYSLPNRAYYSEERALHFFSNKESFL